MNLKVLFIQICLFLSLNLFSQNKVDGKYYGFDNRICQDGNYWRCYMHYYEINFDGNFICIFFPNRLAKGRTECDIFKIENNKLVRGVHGSFEHTDTLNIKKINSQKIVLQAKYQLPDFFTTWNYKKEYSGSLDLKIEKILKRKQNQGFINFNNILIEKGFFTEDEILEKLKNPDFKSIEQYDIRLNFPKKWEKEINKAYKKRMRKLKRSH